MENRISVKEIGQEGLVRAAAHESGLALRAAVLSAVALAIAIPPANAGFWARFRAARSRRVYALVERFVTSDPGFGLLLFAAGAVLRTSVARRVLGDRVGPRAEILAEQWMAVGIQLGAGVVLRSVIGDALSRFGRVFGDVGGSGAAS